jgi:hypothetical protein
MSLALSKNLNFLETTYLGPEEEQTPNGHKIATHPRSPLLNPIISGSAACHIVWSKPLFSRLILVTFVPQQLALKSAVYQFFVLFVFVRYVQLAFSNSAKPKLSSVPGGSFRLDSFFYRFPTNQ